MCRWLGWQPLHGPAASGALLSKSCQGAEAQRSVPASQQLWQAALPRVGAGNRDVLLILLPFTTFVTFLSFLFQAEEKIIKKILKAHNEIKCNSCYIHISGGSPAISSCLPSSGSLWAGVWRGWIRVSYDTVQPVPSTPQCKEATSASEWL